jgi:hypothetical protein
MYATSTHLGMYVYTPILTHLFHNLKSIGNGELGICLTLHLFYLNTRSKFRQCELSSSSVDLEDTLYLY